MIPVRVEACEPAGLLGQRIYIDLVNLPEAAAREALIRGLREDAPPAGPPAFPGRPTEPPKFPGTSPQYAPPIAGMDSRERVFARDRPLPGQVFAVELLTKPVILSRDRRGRICVTVQRDGVTQALYTTEAKQELCRRVFADPDRLADALKLDREIHAFLSGRSSRDSLILPLDNLPLRWSSGGVMSLVRWRDRHWVPFFFRDIQPFGWNISLGASERGDDLDDPWTFLLREFLEETLVLDREPRPGRPLCHKPFDLRQLDVRIRWEDIVRFAQEHRAARYSNDGLVVHAPAESSAANSIPVDVCRTQTEIRIEPGGRGQPPHHNVLVCINLMELVLLCQTTQAPFNLPGS